MPSPDVDYFRTRAIEERQRAVEASSPVIRAVHYDHAARYEQLAGEIRTADEMRSSRSAVQRSMELLRNTDELLARSPRLGGE